MKCLLCKNKAVGCRKIMKITPFDKDNFSFNLYYCLKHLENQLNYFGIEIERDNNEN